MFNLNCSISHVWLQSNIFNIYYSGCVKVQNILRFIVLEKEIIEKLAALYVMFYYPSGSHLLLCYNIASH